MENDWFDRFEDVIEYRDGKDGYQEMIIPNWNTFEEFIEAEIKRGFEAGREPDPLFGGHSPSVLRCKSFEDWKAEQEKGEG